MNSFDGSPTTSTLCSYICLLILSDSVVWFFRKLNSSGSSPMPDCIPSQPRIILLLCLCILSMISFFFSYCSSGWSSLYNIIFSLLLIPVLLTQLLGVILGVSPVCIQACIEGLLFDITKISEVEVHSVLETIIYVRGIEILYKTTLTLVYFKYMFTWNMHSSTAVGNGERIPIYGVCMLGVFSFLSISTLGRKEKLN